jgi:hypothetical protein
VTDRGFESTTQIAANESTECGGNQSERREMRDERTKKGLLSAQILRDGVFGPGKMQFF